MAVMPPFSSSDEMPGGGRVRATVAAGRPVLIVGRWSPFDDVFLAGLIGWEIAGAVAPGVVPTPSAVLRRRPRWIRYLFAGSLAGIVVVHLARETAP